MSEPTLEQELTLLAQHLPAFAQVLLHAMQRGLIHGAPPVTQIIWPAGDAYQHLAHGDDRQGRELAHAVRQDLGMSEWLFTPMERLLSGVRPGARPAFSPLDGPLVMLAQALHPFLSPSSQQGQATVPLLASQPNLWQTTEAEPGQPENRRECHSCQKGINP